MRMSLIALLLLAGCTRTEGEILSRDWVKPDAPAADTQAAKVKAGNLQATNQAVRAPLYCYATLGRVDCHATPIVEEQDRLKGYYGPSPMVPILEPAPLLVPSNMTGAPAPVPAAPPVMAPVVTVAEPPPVASAPVVQAVPEAKTARPGAPTSLRRKSGRLSGSP